MIVRDINPEIFSTIKRFSHEEDVYSYIKKSSVNRNYVETHFFKGEFITWSAFEISPYVKITENLGPINDIANYRKIIMLNQGISQEMYPNKALQEA
jgi:hypothetical protein